MNHDESWYWLTTIKEIHNRDIRKLLSIFGNPEEIYRASEDQLVRSNAVDEQKARAIRMSRNQFRMGYKLEKMKNDGIQFIHYGSENYPQALLILEDPPYALYVKGSLPDPEFPSVGIVGARKCSGYGKEMTLRFAQTLAANGVQIISGMAVGVDSYASKGALEVGGKTFVVLGSGIDVIYPAQNIELYYQIILNGGGVISEYPMGTAPVGWQFPHRNRLISAFSDKLLVMEAKKQSGTLTTAAYALDQGKDVYALPGRVTDLMSEGCNQMIAEGAGVLLDPGLLVEEFYGKTTHSQGIPMQRQEKKADPSGLYEPILKVLDYEPKLLEMLAKESGLSVEEADRRLTEMELLGLCQQPSKDYYSLG